MRKLTTQEKKNNGTYNVTRDKDRDFTIIDGIVKIIPKVPDHYNEMQADLHMRVWRHLVKHEYGKESDKELVDILVHEWTNYVKYREFDHTQTLSEKALKNYLAASNALCLNPNALGRAASLQKKEKGSKLSEALREKIG